MAETENFSTVSAEEDAKYGFTRPEMFSTNLGGTVDAYDRHVFLCHKSPAEWASRVEEDLLPKRLSSAFKSRKDDMKLKEIELEAHAVKGIGKTHAKWSPVGTAWYRMLPEVLLLEDVEDDVAEELVRKCPVKVFDIEDIGKGKKRATVKNPRACTLCRECIIGGEEWEKRVALRRVKDHFICK